jgi:hypothetical protein
MLINKYNNNTYKFNGLFNYFLDEKNNCIIINFKYRYFIIKLPSIFFFKKEYNNKYFIFLKRFYYITFLKHLFNFYNIFFSLYFFNLKLKGLGFRVFIITKNLIKIFLNRSNYYYLHIPISIILKYKTRRFFFLSINYNDLKIMILNLLFLKEFIIYRITGIYYLRQIILVKPGKNKFR